MECFPGKRALHKSNQGQVDAELVRIKSIGSLYPNLIRVPEAIFKVRGMAFVWNKNLSIRSKQDLRGHRVGIVRGIQWATEMSEGLSPKIASSAYDLFKLLAQRQIDIALELRRGLRPRGHADRHGQLHQERTPRQGRIRQPVGPSSDSIGLARRSSR